MVGLTRSKKVNTPLIKSSRGETFIIAEVGINHGGSVDVAKRLIDSAARAGVDAVKFQTYITEQRAPAGNTEFFEVLKRCELPFEAFEKLKSHAANQGLTFFSTPFDLESVQCLESINVDMYKIASFDVTNHRLLRGVAATRKLVLMSVGMATEGEIAAAYSVLKEGLVPPVVMHCISSYPLDDRAANLAAIVKLKENYVESVIGYSDHTAGVRIAPLAVAVGARVIEKHFKIDDSMDCVDSALSISEADMRRMIGEIRQVEEILGDGYFGVRDSEAATAVFRRRSI